MSSAYGENPSGESDAKSVRAQAAEWHDRSERADWSAENQAELDAWLGASPAHLVAYLRVDSAWRRADRLSALRQTPAEIAAEPRRRIKLGFGQFVAGFAVVAALSAVAASYFLSPREQVYATAVGGHKTIALEGGSQIELNTDTALRVSMDGTQRKVWLDRGEAYFQVTHDAAHPFVVMAAGLRVTDLGTKFLIRRDMGHLQVAMVQGRVRFDVAGQHPATLMPGDVLDAAGSAVSVTRKPARELTAELGWRHGMLVFNNTALADAVGEFNRYNRIKLLIADQAAGRMPIDGKFRTSDVASFTLLVQSVLGLRVTGRGEEIVISR